MVAITLPDGSVRKFEQPVTVGEVAASIGPGLAKAALGGKVDGKLVDTSYRVDRDAKLAIVTDKDPEGLDMIRHSTAHLLAYAVKELFPDAQVTIGPVIENGFYYDFAFKRPFTPEDLEKIEKRMADLAKKDIPVAREEWNRDEAVKFFNSIGEKYKAQIIASIPSQEGISLYREGDFIDLCRGPHVPSTGKLKVFKLMKVAGAYWRGDSHNEMLQRIYGTAWAKKEDQEAYLKMLEEAEKRDHRRIGKQLDLFHMQDEAPGMVFWHPKGWAIWQQVEQYMRRVYVDNGYQEVRCPMILDVSLWKKSGHWENYKENMFFTESEKRDFAVKPMNCPGHVQVFNSDLRSYRDLPLRYGEFGACHRNEPSGALHGIMRVRGFTQDDGHIFCTEDQIPRGMRGLHEAAAEGLRGFRFQGNHLQGCHAPREARGRRRAVGESRARAHGVAARLRRAVRDLAGRGRVLRPEDRVFAEGCDRARVAVRHDAGGLQHAAPAGRGVRRRAQRKAASGDVAPRHRGLHGALHRHPDREPCGRAAVVAGSCPGGGDERDGPPGILCAGGGRRCPGRGIPGRRRFAERENNV
jgi:hypothetical protein